MFVPGPVTNVPVPCTCSGTGRPAPPPLQEGVRGRSPEQPCRAASGAESGAEGGVAGDLRLRGNRPRRPRGGLSAELGSSARTRLSLLSRVTLSLGVTRCLGSERCGQHRPSGQSSTLSLSLTPQASALQVPGRSSRAWGWPSGQHELLRETFRVCKNLN